MKEIIKQIMGNLAIAHYSKTYQKQGYPSAQQVWIESMIKILEELQSTHKEGINISAVIVSMLIHDKTDEAIKELKSYICKKEIEIKEVTPLEEIMLGELVHESCKEKTTSYIKKNFGDVFKKLSNQ